MKKPFLKFHQNNEGGIVMTYIGEANFGEQITPESLVIEQDDFTDFVSSLNEYYEEIING